MFDFAFHKYLLRRKDRNWTVTRTAISQRGTRLAVMYHRAEDSASDLAISSAITDVICLFKVAAGLSELTFVPLYQPETQIVEGSSITPSTLTRST